MALRQPDGERIPVQVLPFCVLLFPGRLGLKRWADVYGVQDNHLPGRARFRIRRVSRSMWGGLGEVPPLAGPLLAPSPTSLGLFHWELTGLLPARSDLLIRHRYLLSSAPRTEGSAIMEETTCVRLAFSPTAMARSVLLTLGPVQ